MLLVLGMQEYERKKFLLVLRFASLIHGFNKWIANFAVFVDCSGYMFDNVKGCNDVE